MRVQTDKMIDEIVLQPWVRGHFRGILSRKREPFVNIEVVSKLLILGPIFLGPKKIGNQISEKIGAKIMRP